MIAMSSHSAMKWYERISVGTCLVVGAASIAVQALVLFVMGQPPICACGYVRLWGGIASGPEMSQQFTDWFSYSHVIHGIGFYFMLWLIAPRASVAIRFILALGFEVSWEIVENTHFVIDRYRQSALAQGYFGDSIINSVGDTIASAFGFFLAGALPAWGTVALAISVELFTAYMIHDNLTLNIIQLIHPTDAISHWQTGN
jgi:hypothetical protein